MANAIINKIAYQLLLDVGNQTIKRISLGSTINPKTADDDKAIAIASAVLPCIEASFSSLSKTTTSSIESD